MATLYKTDGTVEDVDIVGATNSLEAMQHAVGGYIEVVGQIDPSHLMLANEEGLLMNLPLNPFCTKFFGKNAIVVGDMLLVEVGTEIN